MMMSDEEIELGGIKINVAMNLVTKNGQNLGLEPKWTQVLAVLARHVNKPVTRETIIQAVWADYIVGEDSLNRAISQIRKVLTTEPALTIDTIRGIGYQLIHQTADNSNSEQALRTTKNDRWGKWWPVIVGIIAALITALLVLIPHYGAPYEPPVYRETVVTSDPGIEYSPHVSPDSKYLAYLWNGGSGDQRKIYIKEIGSQNTVRFTSSNRIERGPTWSNDGRKLAYFSSEPAGQVLNISPFLINQPVALDTVESIVRGASMSWGPDDQQLIYAGLLAGEKNYKIYQYDIASHKRKVILESSDPKIHYANAIFSPDGTKMAVLVRQKHHLSQTVDLNQVFPVGIQVYDYKRMKLEYEREFDAAIHSVSWKGQGRLLYVIENNNQYVIQELSLESNKIEELYRSDKIMRNVTYNRLEETIYLEAWYGNVNMHQVRLKAGLLEERTTFLASSRFDWGPTLSADEQKLAFLSARSGLTQVWLHDFETNTTRQLSKFSEEGVIRSLSWNRKGTQLVMDRLEKRNTGHALIMDIDGKVIHQISIPKQSISNPTWSADDNSLYMVLADSSSLLSNWRYDLTTGSMENISIDGAIDLWQIEDQFYFTKKDKRGLWKAPMNDRNDITLVNERLSYLRSRYWNITNDTLMMFNLYGYTNVLESVDLRTGTLIDSLEVAGFLPTGEPSAVFFKDKRMIFTVVDGLETEIIALKPDW